MVLELLIDADSCIFNRKTIICYPVLAGYFTYINKYGTMLPVILDGIINNIHQNLFQMQRIANQPAVLQIDLLHYQLNF